MNITEALKLSKQNLSDDIAGITLLKSILNTTLEQLITLGGSHQLTHNETQILKEHIQKASLNEPIAYIIKNKEFYSRDFFINESVLIPRDDTETLIDAVLETVNQDSTENTPNKQPKINILDIGTGSGIIGITLSLSAPNFNTTGIDICDKALAVAKLNATKHHCEQINFKILDLKDMDKEFWSKFNIIISNPPYIKTQEIQTLEPSVKNYEPHKALDGGQDGLQFYKILLTKMSEFAPAPESASASASASASTSESAPISESTPAPQRQLIFFEIGHTQLDEICQIASSLNLSLLKTWKDHSKITRVCAFHN